MQVLRAGAHGLSRGIISVAQGGTFKSGFASGFTSSLFSPGSTYGGKTAGGFALRTSIASIVGGTASKLGGGKFSNGAVSGALVHMFNAEGGTWKRLWNSLKTCTAEHIGLETAAGATAVAAGAPIVPKTKASGAFGSTKNTSLVSKPLRQAFPQRVSGVKMPTSIVRYSGMKVVTSVGAGMARAIPVVGEVILIYDGVSIGSCVVGKHW